MAALPNRTTYTVRTLFGEAQPIRDEQCYVDEEIQMKGRTEGRKRFANSDDDEGFDSGPDQTRPHAVVRVIGEPEEQIPTFFSHRDGELGSTPRDLISVGTTLTAFARDYSDKWLFFVWGWIARDHVFVIEGSLSELPIAMDCGLWAISVTENQDAMQLATVAKWNT